MSSIQPAGNRLIALDAFRGFTIVAMVIVNSPGSWKAVYGPLLHAPWHGGTPTDLIFPFFLFIVGVSITLALGKLRTESGFPPGIRRKILLRALKIFAIGLLLAFWRRFDLQELRIAGVLQRIAIVYAVAAFIFVHTNWRQVAWITASLLVGYWALMTLVPVPVDAVIAAAIETGSVARGHGGAVAVSPVVLSESWIAANYQPGINLEAWLDRHLLPGPLYESTWDPEGLLSTLPSVATCLLGILCGHLLRIVDNGFKRVAWLFMAGFILFCLGIAWSWQFPLNKNLWSSSFVLWSGGLAMQTLAACLLVIDICGYRKWAGIGIIYGANAITAYALSGLLIPVFYDSVFGQPPLNTAFVEGMAALGSPAKLASLLYAILYMLLIFIPAWLLYRKRIYIRV